MSNFDYNKFRNIMEEEVNSINIEIKVQKNKKLVESAGILANLLKKLWRWVYEKLTKKNRTGT